MNTRINNSLRLSKITFYVLSISRAITALKETAHKITHRFGSFNTTERNKNNKIRINYAKLFIYVARSKKKTQLQQCAATRTGLKWTSNSSSSRYAMWCTCALYTHYVHLVFLGSQYNVNMRDDDDNDDEYA